MPDCADLAALWGRSGGKRGHGEKVQRCAAGGGEVAGIAALAYSPLLHMLCHHLGFRVWGCLKAFTSAAILCKSS